MLDITRKMKADYLPIIPNEFEQSDPEDHSFCSKFRTIARRTKNKVALVTASWLVINAISRSIVFPTLFLYIAKRNNLETANKWYGWTLATTYMGTLLATPLCSYISQKRLLRVKTMVATTNVLSIVGNIMYFVGPYPWVLLLGRTIDGTGLCLDLVMFSEVARTTTQAERTIYMTCLLMCRQVGLSLGPALNLITGFIDFDVLGFKVDVYNLAGALVAILRLLHTIASVFLIPHLSHTQFNKDGTAKEVIEGSTLEPESKIKSQAEAETSLWDIIKRIMRMETFATLLTAVSCYFGIMALDTILSPLAHKNFGWEEGYTSLVFLGLTILLLLMFIAVLLCSKYLEDRILLVLGIAIMFGSFFWLMVTFCFINPYEKPLYITLTLIGASTVTIGQPFALSISESMYSKIVQDEDMNVAQSIRSFSRTTSHGLGMLLGGIFIGWQTMLITTILVLGSTILTTMAYKKLDFACHSKQKRDDNEQAMKS